MDSNLLASISTETWVFQRILALQKILSDRSLFTPKFMELISYKPYHYVLVFILVDFMRVLVVKSMS